MRKQVMHVFMNFVEDVTAEDLHEICYSWEKWRFHQLVTIISADYIATHSDYVSIIEDIRILETLKSYRPREIKQ